MPESAAPSDDCRWELARLRMDLLAASFAWRSEAAVGSLRLVFVAPPKEQRLTGDVAEGTAVLDEIFVRDLCREIRDVGTPGVVVLIARPTTVGTRRDRLFARSLRLLLEDGQTRLVDALAITPDSARSLVWPRQVCRDPG